MGVRVDPLQGERGFVRRVLHGSSAQRVARRAVTISDHAGWIAAALSAVWLTALMYVAWPALRYPVFVSDSNIDSAFFAYGGELLRHGGTPYVSFWDHKPPLIFLIDAAALSLSGGAVWGLWAASLVTLLACLVLAQLTLRRPFGQLGAALGIITFAFAMPHMLASNLTEEYALPLQWASALLLVRWAYVTQSRDVGANETQRRPREFTVGTRLGVLAALAFALKANLIGAQVSVAIAMSIVLLAQRRIAAWTRFVLGGIAGVAVIWAVIFAYVASRGALGPFMDQVFHYNFLYAGTTTGLRIRAMVAGIGAATHYTSFVLPFSAWVLAAVLLARDLSTRRIDDDETRARSIVRLFALVWPPVELVMSAASGRVYLHYFVALLPPIAFLAAMFADEVDRQLTRADVAAVSPSPRGTVLIGGIIAAIALLSVASTGIQLRDTDTGVVAARRAQVDDAVRYLQTHTPADARVLVWGHASDVYFLSQRRPASRFVYSLPLLTPGYADSTLVASFLAELQSAKPPVIVDATAGPIMSDRIVPPLSRWQPDWRYPADQGPSVRWWSMTPALRAFYDYVAANYVPADTIGPQRWIMYRRVSRSSS